MRTALEEFSSRMIQIVIPGWLAVVAGIAAPLAILWLKTWIQSRAQAGVKAAFDKRLETHKHELQQLGEANRFSLQRTMQEFSLFATKKHEVYAGLYRRVRLSEGRLADVVSGVRITPTFLDFDREDVEKFLTEMRYSARKIREVLEAFDVSPEKAVEAYEEHQPTVKLFRARKRLDSAISFFLLNELYLSPEVAELSQKLLLGMRELLYGIMSGASEPFSEERQLLKRITTELEKVRGQMQQEVQAGARPVSAIPLLPIAGT
jgi:hypothetical protein